MRIIIIGGGIIGLCAAWYLHKAGHEIVLLDKTDMTDGCSYGNAGMIVPSHIIPLAAPGMIARGIRWMFDAESPFYIALRLRPDLLRWGWLFYRTATEKKVRRAMPVLRDFHLLSKQLYTEMVQKDGLSFAFQQNGIGMIYRSKHGREEELATARKANELGIETRELDQKGLQALEPLVQTSAMGAVYYPGDAHLDPGSLMNALRNQLTAAGVHFQQGVSANGFTREKPLRLNTNKGLYRADRFVIAAGAWTPQLTRSLGLRLPMQAGKGYSFTIRDAAPQLRHPAILTEAKIAVTPLGPDLRFAGTMEIGGLHHRINPARVRGILKAIPTYFPEYDFRGHPPSDIWCGLRPCTPDGMPYIGPCPNQKNVVVAAGHAMMGLSLGPATGKLVQEIIDNQPTSLDTTLFQPKRFG